MKKIERYAFSEKPDLAFDYDPMGRRITKTVYPKSAPGVIDVDGVMKTYYVYDSQGNVMTVYTLKTEEAEKNLYLSERMLYGSTRLGMEQVNQIVASTNSGNIDINTKQQRVVGDKIFEMSNYLGNILATVTDRKLPEFDLGEGLAYYKPDVISFSDFFPGHGLLTGRNGNSNVYRYGGANGQEKVDEVSGVGNHYTADYWEYDSRVLRRWNNDPVTKPWMSPYHVFEGNPVFFADPSGANGEITIQDRDDGQGEEMVLSNTVILYKGSGLTDEQFDNYVSNYARVISQISNGQRFMEVDGPDGVKNLTVRADVQVLVAKDEQEALRMAAEVGETANIFKVFNGMNGGSSYVASSGEGAGWQGELVYQRLQDNASHEWLHLFGLEDRYLLGITKKDPFSPTDLNNAETRHQYAMQVKNDPNYHSEKNPNIMVNGSFTNLSKGQVRYLYSQIGVKKPSESGWEFGKGRGTQTVLIISKPSEINIKSVLSYVTLSRCIIYHPKLGRSHNGGKRAYNNLSTETKRDLNAVFQK